MVGHTLQASGGPVVGRTLQASQASGGPHTAGQWWVSGGPHTAGQSGQWWAMLCIVYSELCGHWQCIEWWASGSV